MGKDVGWWNGGWIGNHCPEKFPFSESEWASLVPVRRSFLCYSTQCVECDNVFAQGLHFL